VLIRPTEEENPLGLSIDVSTFRKMSPYPPEAHLKELKATLGEWKICPKHPSQLPKDDDVAVN
jgi:hypothetical protein